MTRSALAQAADVLSDQLRLHLKRLAKVLKPHATDLDTRFRMRLRDHHYDLRQLKALSEITPGAAALVIAGSDSLPDFFEQVEYSGRRLAKLNVLPGDILRALREYDRVLDPLLHHLLPGEYTNFQWAREQLQFCVILTLNNAFYQVREVETEAFYELFRAELEADNLNDLLARFLQTLTKTCNARAGRLLLIDEKTDISSTAYPLLLRPRYVERGDKAIQVILDPVLRRREQSFWSIPLFSAGRLKGVMQFAFSTAYKWLPRELQLLEAAGERCLAAAEKARLMADLASREEQVRRLAEHMLEVEEEERRRISRELHDEAGQSLLSIRLQMEMLEKSLPPHLSEFQTKLAEIREIAEHTIVEIRRVISALSPAVLERMGLPAALRQLVTRFRQTYPGRVRLYVPIEMGRLPKEAEFITYRLVQECCNNIAKHSSAANVNIRLSSTDQILELHVEDDGVGFDVETALRKRDSFGLAGMQERVALLGGKFQIESRPKGGTRISVELPIRSGK